MSAGLMFIIALVVGMGSLLGLGCIMPLWIATIIGCIVGVVACFILDKLFPEKWDGSYGHV